MKLSTFERRTLAAIAELKDAYGATIHNQMGALVDVGAVYVTLDELEEKGLVVVQSVRGRQCYALTEEGQREIAR